MRFDLKVIASWIEPGSRVATLTVRAPEGDTPKNPEELAKQGANAWPIRAFRELDDALLEQAGEVRGCGDAIARPDLFGDRAPAQQFAPLQHQHLAPAARQIGGPRQGIL